jgi:hypothetical protein
MSCLSCQNLERALEVRQSEYIEAIASPYYRFSRKFAAYRSVELERAKNELEEHRSVCVSVLEQPTASVNVTLPRVARKEPRGECTVSVRGTHLYCGAVL